MFGVELGYRREVNVSLMSFIMVCRWSFFSFYKEENIFSTSNLADFLGHKVISNSIFFRSSNDFSWCLWLYNRKVGDDV